MIINHSFILHAFNILMQCSHSVVYSYLAEIFFLFFSRSSFPRRPVLVKYFISLILKGWLRYVKRSVAWMTFCNSLWTEQKFIICFKEIG